MTKEDSNLKLTLKELETAFNEWDKLTPEKPEDPVASETDNIKEQAKNILNKLKTQIKELS